MKFNKTIIGISIGAIFLGLVLMTIGYFGGGRSGVVINSSGIHSAGTIFQNQRKSPHVLEKTKLDSFSEIDINIDYADLELIPADGFYLEYRLSGNSTAPKYSVNAGKLMFEEGKNNGYFNTGINFMFWNWNNGESYSYNEDYYVKLYIPEDQEFGLFRIYNDYGDLTMADLKADDLQLELDYGDLEMGDAICRDMNIEFSSGGLNTGSIQTETFKVYNDYGDVTIKDLKADDADLILSSGIVKLKKAEISRLNIENDYGDVVIRDITGGIAEFNLSSGSLELGGADIKDIEVENDYGSVQIDLINKFNDYNYDLDTDYGKIRLPAGTEARGEDGEYIYKTDNESDRLIKVDCSSGNITITEDGKQ